MIRPLITIWCLFTLAGYVLADAPEADYSYYVEYIGFGSEVSFLNESIDADTYLWDFGDGATSTDLHPVHAYPEPGIFIVCLTATNAFGSDIFCDTINTYYPPSADFDFSGDPFVAFTDLTTNYPTEWVWFFGDDDTSHLQNPTHTFLINGDYNVCLSANNPGGTSYTCKTVSIVSYPVTEATFSYTGDPLVLFTDLSTESPFAWSWDFGDGDSSSEQNPEHTYTENGTFNVCLTATNAGGTDTYCATVVITHAIAPPVADFSYLVLDLAVAFVDASENAPFAWYWEFDDDSVSTEQNPVHAFAAPGNYTVCLTATNEGGNNTVCKNIFLAAGIATPPEKALTVYPNPADDMIRIDLPVSVQTDAIYLYDSAGKCCLYQMVKGKPVVLSGLDLPSGNYFIRLCKNGQIIAVEKIAIR